MTKISIVVTGTDESILYENAFAYEGNEPVPDDYKCNKGVCKDRRLCYLSVCFLRHMGINTNKVEYFFGELISNIELPKENTEALYYETFMSFNYKGRTICAIDIVQNAIYVHGKEPAWKFERGNKEDYFTCEVFGKSIDYWRWTKTLKTIKK